MSRLRSTWQQISVAMAEGSHPFPFRTRKLSPPAPMVLGSRGPGRVGRRRARTSEGPPAMGVLRRFPRRLAGPMPKPPASSSGRGRPPDPPAGRGAPRRRGSGRAPERGAAVEAARGRRRQAQEGRLGRRGPQGRRAHARRGPRRRLQGVPGRHAGRPGALGARAVDRRGRGPGRGPGRGRTRSVAPPEARRPAPDDADAAADPTLGRGRAGPRPRAGRAAPAGGEHGVQARALRRGPQDPAARWPTRRPPPSPSASCSASPTTGSAGGRRPPPSSRPSAT